MVNRKQVLKTLLYFDIFDFPPQKEEIWHFLEVKIVNEDFLSFLAKLKIPNYKSYYFLKSKKIAKDRLTRQSVNKLKLKKAKSIIKKLSFIPSIKFIGISGSLAMQNSDKNDDIDLLVITTANLTWFTRFVCVVVLTFLGVYRTSGDKNVRNKICLNYLISETALYFNKDKHNLYLAHEIVQMLPILNVDNTYQKFINNNSWIYNFLPNSSQRTNNYKIPFIKSITPLNRKLIQIIQFINLEKFAKFFQWQYMRRKITREKVSENILAFHPINYETKILEKYRQEIGKIK